MFCWSALQGLERLYWPEQWQERQMCHSTTPLGPSLTRCLLEWEPAASGTFSVGFCFYYFNSKIDLFVCVVSLETTKDCKVLLIQGMIVEKAAILIAVLNIVVHLCIFILVLLLLL